MPIKEEHRFWNHENKVWMIFQETLSDSFQLHQIISYSNFSDLQSNSSKHLWFLFFSLRMYVQICNQIKIYEIILTYIQIYPHYYFHKCIHHNVLIQKVTVFLLYNIDNTVSLQKLPLHNENWNKSSMWILLAS